MQEIINVLIFGTGSLAEYLILSLKKNINIVGYIDNNEKRQGQKFYDKDIISPKDISNFTYDYILIASQGNDEIYEQLIEMGIDKFKIFEFFKFNIIKKNVFENKIKLYEENVNEIEGIITGISYIAAGINPEYIKKRTINLALASQDLYYDYAIVEYILSKYINNNIKYCIIGLNYYSFQYDLSLSSMKSKIFFYYNILNKKHNFNSYSNTYFNFENNMEIADKLFNKNEQGRYIVSWRKDYKYSSQLNTSHGKNQAAIDCNKDYPETVKENIEIFNKYLQLLKSYNIKPIVVVCPASKYYTKYFSERIENEFNTIMDEFKSKYDFQYLDYFRSDLFNDEDFYDVSHLNEKGAAKFTNILNEIIEW